LASSPCSFHLAQLGRHDRHDRPHPVLRFGEHQGRVAVYYFVRHLLHVTGEAVQEDGPRIGPSHQVGIHLVPVEFLDPFGVFLLLPHAHPGVGDDHVGAPDGVVGDRRRHDRDAVLLREPLRGGHDAGVGFVPLGGRDLDVHAHLDRPQHEIVQHVVAVPHPGHGLPRQVRSEVLLQRHEVGQSLEGMVQVAEGVDDGDGRILGEFGDVLVGVHAGQYQVVEPAQHARRVPHALVDSQLDVRGAQEEGVAAQQRHARFGRNAGPRGPLLEDHAHRMSVEGFRQGLGLVGIGRLVLVRDVQEALQFVVAAMKDIIKS
jgi:hypothetical protein